MEIILLSAQSASGRIIPKMRVLNPRSHPELIPRHHMQGFVDTKKARISPSFLYSRRLYTRTRDLFAHRTLLLDDDICVSGRGDRNRTRISGFGDRCTAIVRHPCSCSLIIKNYEPLNKLIIIIVIILSLFQFFRENQNNNNINNC